ncbi:unnamed protein product [Cuscuta epithymum]|uniref:Uncharacterized protein n=1 Tax=Cuscuta epithymum TaxID=186058 RepID=A0AAV0DQE6_9ASTE|nr:unnamed protein product [Cuscuta epithymum]
MPNPRNNLFGGHLFTCLQVRVHQPVIAARIGADSEDETVSLRRSNKKLQSTSPLS